MLQLCEILDLGFIIRSAYCRCFVVGVEVLLQEMIHPSSYCLSVSDIFINAVESVNIPGNHT